MLISAQQNKEEMLISTVSFTAVVCLLFLWDRREGTYLTSAGH
jgi:hypothetical protein